MVVFVIFFKYDFNMLNVFFFFLGMVDGKYCIFLYLFGKIFVYNVFEDRLELCVDVVGYFFIGFDVEDLVKEVVSQVRVEVIIRSRELSFLYGLLKLGSGGVVKKKFE